MGIQHLDLLLHFMYDNRKYMYMEQIHKEFSKIHKMSKIDILVLLNKLVKDGYVTEEVQKLTTEKRGILTSTDEINAYFISFEGVLFIEASPFIFQNRPYKWNEIRTTAKTIWTVLKIIMIALNALAIIVLTYLQATKP